MKQINQLIQKIFPPIQSLPTGVYHYQAPPDSDFPYRLHLRIEKDGTSILIVNASTVLHMNETATEYAYHIVQQTPKEDVIHLISKRYNTKKEQVVQDFDDFSERLKTLIEMPDLDPVTFLDFDRDTPYSTEISAPYRLDCAVTYNLTDGNPAMAAPTDRVIRELNTEEWKIILSKAWEAGIPHVILTGGEPTLREDLPDIIAHAESIGLVTGLLTDGVSFANKEYLQKVLACGLDHLMIILDPQTEKTWNALENIMPEDIYTTVHLTITSEDANESIAVIDHLHTLGVESLSLSTSNSACESAMQQVHHYIDTIPAMSLVWDLPVPYSKQNPVNLELEKNQEAPQGAGKAWLYVEPDGDVLVSQGLPEVLGNILTDPWERIWK